MVRVAGRVLCQLTACRDARDPSGADGFEVGYLAADAELARVSSSEAGQGNGCDITSAYKAQADRVRLLRGLRVSKG